MTTPNPFAHDYAPTPTDEDLASLAADGDRSALEQLLARHQAWLFNIAFRMLHHRADAEDATQESLLKIATRLGQFRGESRFRTWAYRIAIRHVLDRKRSRPEQVVTGFDCYTAYFDRTADEDPPDPASLADARLVLEEAKMSCTMGMLLCLDREQRLVFVLGTIFEASDTVASEVLGISRDAFRQKLCRAREQLIGFMQNRCSLMDEANPCRCERKTRAFIRDGIVDPKRLVFATGYVQKVRELSTESPRALTTAAEEACTVLYREQPFYDPPEIAARLRSLIEQEPLRRSLALSSRRTPGTQA